MSSDPGPERPVPVASPLQGTVVKVGVTPGQEVAAGGMLLIIESMKMEHVVSASRSGTIASVAVGVGDLVADGETVVVIEPGGPEAGSSEVRTVHDADTIRPDLAETLARQALTLDPARPEMVERRHREHRRTARENINDLCDPGSFTEYGSLAIAAQRNRRDLEELIARTPADGLVAGIGRINGDQFGDRAACAALSYDYTVLAGTQGQQNHRKKDRMFELIERLRLPVVLFAEGGGGRPGDTDNSVITGLDCMAFALFGGLSGLVP
ncbi:MAG TPA: biotin/lipoyl-containing protein, partial [Acidimicrobiales bacterium]